MKRFLQGAAVAALIGGAGPATAATCEGLAGMALADGRVESAVATKPSDMIALGGTMPGLPAGAAFCRVKATLKPTLSSDIKVEVWLPPAEAWNGKLLGAGNGGYGGGFGSPFLTMRGGVTRGYAAAGTDMGHTSATDIDAKWALNQPEKIKDFGYRANHVTAEAAKALVAAYYGTPQKRAYFHGCSDGGREALMEARKFPADYDAIIAGAPASPWTGLMSAFMWNDRLATRPGGAIPNAKLALVTKAVMAQCDALDGVTDGVLEDPRACRFDPGKLQCKAGDGPDCLTPAQVETVRGLYRGPRTKAGNQLFSGFPAGGEGVPGAWDMWITGPNAQHGRFATEFFRYMVHSDPAWTGAGFDLDRDHARALKAFGGILDSADPDLSAFQARGGKLLMYHGWADAAIPAGNTVGYYEAVRGKLGAAKADPFIRLFMVPGMSHCLGGPGPNVFDVLGALDGWRESGVAPETLVARKTDNDIFGYLGFPAKTLRTRPLCAYPKVARWIGQGSTDDAANFRCELAKR